MLTTTELIIAANTQVNLRTDHISQPGSSPTHRFVGGPSTCSHTTKLAPTPRHTPHLYDTQVRHETSDDTHEPQQKAQTTPVLRQPYLPTRVQQEVDPVHDEDYPYWDRAADPDHYTSLYTPPPFETQASSLDVPHAAEHHRPWHITVTRWKWDMSCEDGKHVTAIQFADDLLVNDAQHQDVRHLAAILTTAMTLRQGGTTYE